MKRAVPSPRLLAASHPAKLAAPEYYLMRRTRRCLRVVKAAIEAVNKRRRIGASWPKYLNESAGGMAHTRRAERRA